MFGLAALITSVATLVVAAGGLRRVNSKTDKNAESIESVRKQRDECLEALEAERKARRAELKRLRSQLRKAGLAV